MPLHQERPVVVKRGPSQLAADDRGPAATTTAVVSHSTPTATMSTTTNYDNINDEEELHKLMNATDNFDERKKIRARLKEIREKQREEMEARRRQREKETEDLVRRKFALAEEEKKRKMEAYHSQKATCERGSDYASTSQKLITDKHRLAEEEKQKRLEAYKNIASKEHQRDDGKTSVKTVTSTSRAPDGSTTVTKKTETTTTVKQTSGFGGVQYGGGPEGEDAESKGPEKEGSELRPGQAAGSAEPSKDGDPPVGPEAKAADTATLGAQGGGAQRPADDDSKETEKSATEEADKTKQSEDATKKDQPASEPASGQTAKDTKENASDQGPSSTSKAEDAAKADGKKPTSKQATASKQPELNTRSLKEQLSGVSGPGSSGSITIRTESWSSRDGVVHKAQKTESWGAKPQGPRGAMAAFKQMDAANPSAKPTNGLVAVSLAKRAATTMRRNAVAIKEEILRFVKANTQDYENVEVTNFSSSWNNGLAFCALIHHFFPDAFDYSQLDAKNRRHNFDLAFDTAEKLADIAPLLDTDDMVKMKNPDWKCVFTYVQSIYRHLRDHENNKAKAPAES